MRSILEVGSEKLLEYKKEKGVELYERDFRRDSEP